MLRLAVPLCILMVATLMIAGEDKGQMRPGLARAVAEGEDIVVVKPRRIVAVAPTPAPEKVAETATVTLAATTVAKPAAPAPATAKATPSPVFTLSTLPTIGGDRVELAAASGDDTDIRYVKGNRVNVRMAPSTDSAVVGQLTGGEAVLVLGPAGNDWVEITIEGDGIHGYMAARLLSRVSP